MHQKYLALYAAQLLRDGDCIAALALYSSTPSSGNTSASTVSALSAGAPPALPQNINIYNRIALECLGQREQAALDAGLWRNLRNFLLQVVLAFRSGDTNNTAGPPLSAVDRKSIDRFDDQLLIAHYYAVRAACRTVPALATIGTRLSVALLRYTEMIPVDKAFYEAGMALRAAGRDGEAFVMLNHYLDVCDAIEGAESLVDHLDLTATDIPSSVPIPERMHLAGEPHVHENIREWILAISMDQRVDQTLPADDERGLYEASLAPGEEPCLVSGYPVVVGGNKSPVTFQRSNWQANREAWSKLTVAAKMAAHSEVPDVLAFVERWCGAANYMGN